MNVPSLPGRPGVWRYARLGGALLSIPLLLWACTSHPLEKPEPLPDQQTDDYYAVNPIRDVDMLFVIDDSGSTGNKQMAFARNFPAFMQSLRAIPGGLPNVRIGVVTSDLGAGGVMTGNNCAASGDGGRFFTTDVTTGANCGLQPNEQYITNTNLLPNMQIETVFACMARRNANGCGYEHQLQAANVALHPTAVNPMNANFLRENAYLAIVFLTDEDDCSGTPDSAAFFTGAAPAGINDNSKCAAAGHLCNGAPPPGMIFSTPLNNCQANPTPMPGTLIPVDQIVADIKGLKPGHEEKIIVAAIAGWPPDGNPAGVNYAMRGGALVDIAQICTAGGGGTPALRIKAFLDSFKNNTLQTICQADYTMALKTIGDLVGTVVGNPCISAPVVDTDLLKAGVQADCVVEDQVNGVITPLPRCDLATTKPCWSLAAASTCTASGFQMAIDRGGKEPPVGLRQAVKCRTCAKPDPKRCHR
jgi:hypothetical protein